MEKKVDALEAGEKNADYMSWLAKMCVMPLYIYFFMIPFFKSVWIPLANSVLPVSITGYEAPLPVYGPELDAGDYWMSWGYWVAKYAFMAMCFCICMMLLIWAKQESILYVPSQPIQYIEENPAKYRSPEERGMLFKEIKIKTDDNLNLQGWFIY